MNRFVEAIKIVRPVNIAISFASIITAGIICINGEYDFYKIILAGISGAFVAAAGNIINDYFDIEIDKINRPDRVLPSGLLTKRESIILYLFFTSSAIIMSVFINPPAVAIVLIATIIIFLYSYKIKRIILLGNIVVSFFLGLAFVYGGDAVNNWSYGIIPGILAFFVSLIREIIKDIEDLEGDNLLNIITFPNKYGIKNTIFLINILTITLMILTTLPFVFNIYGIEYFLLVMMAVNTVFVYFLKELNKDQSKQNISRLSGLLKLNMVFGLIAIFLGNIN